MRTPDSSDGGRLHIKVSMGIAILFLIGVIVFAPDVRPADTPIAVEAETTDLPTAAPSPKVSDPSRWPLLRTPRDPAERSSDWGNMARPADEGTEGNDLTF